jgi:DNA-binding response OmpR family regulator
MSKKILIADDEPNILISLEFLMKREGYEVVVARDGQEALDGHREGAAGAGAAGRDDAREDRLRRLPRGASERVPARHADLMLTAKGRDTDVAKGLALGANAYMTKPFSTKELVQKVREMLGEAHERRTEGMSMSAQQRTDRRLWWLLAAVAILSIGWLLLDLCAGRLHPGAGRAVRRVPSCWGTAGC